MTNQNNKTQQAAQELHEKNKDLLLNGYGITVSALYQLLEHGAKGDAAAIRGLKGAGFVVGNAIDVIQLIDATVKNDERRQLSAGCSIAGGAIGGALGGMAKGSRLGPYGAAGGALIGGAMGAAGASSACEKIHDYQHQKQPKNKSQNHGELEQDKTNEQAPTQAVAQNQATQKPQHQTHVEHCINHPSFAKISLAEQQMALAYAQAKDAEVNQKQNAQTPQQQPSNVAHNDELNERGLNKRLLAEAQAESAARNSQSQGQSV
jgi:hypothetical protein